MCTPELTFSGLLGISSSQRCFLARNRLRGVFTGPSCARGHRLTSVLYGANRKEGALTSPLLPGTTGLPPWWTANCPQLFRAEFVSRDPCGPLEQEDLDASLPLGCFLARWLHNAGFGWPSARTPSTSLGALQNLAAPRQRGGLGPSPRVLDASPALPSRLYEHVIWHEVPK